MDVQGAEQRRNGVYCLYFCLSVIIKWQFFQFCPKLRRQKSLISIKHSATHFRFVPYAMECVRSGVIQDHRKRWTGFETAIT